MTLNGGHAGEPVRLGQDRIAQLHDQLVVHADDPMLGGCLVCGSHHCAAYTVALAELIAAGEASVP